MSAAHTDKIIWSNFFQN